jgi:hypothetical protein
MIKTKIVWIEELEIYLNKYWFIFLCSHQDKFIFKYTENTSRQITALTETDKFFNLDNEWIEKYSHLISERLWKDYEFINNELNKFIDYRSEKSEWAKKCKRQKQNSFEVPLRFKAWLWNTKQPLKSNPNLWTL